MISLMVSPCRTHEKMSVEARIVWMKRHANAALLRRRHHGLDEVLVIRPYLGVRKAKDFGLRTSDFSTGSPMSGV